MIAPLIICFVLLISLYAIAVFTYRLQTSLAAAPKLSPAPQTPHPTTTISVIIPAYNEEINIKDCVQAVLNSKLADPQKLAVWIADDESTDRTYAIAQEIAHTDPRVHVIAGLPRPQNEIWRGKNWACANAVEQATGEYLLFIDADVRLEPNAIADALSEAQIQQTDLLSCAPEIICGCFSEWLVQPIMMSVLAVGSDFSAVNDPANLDTAFAAGPFMLFRRDAYTKIGGHRAVADDLVEDVGLARLVKRSGLKLRYMLALGLMKVRMYQSFAALWEGWTKNYYMGAQRNLGTTLYSALAMTLVFVVPWVGLVVGLGYGVWGVIAGSYQLSAISFILLLSLVAIAAQYYLRASSAKTFGQPLRYWWLSWLGGGLVAAIAIASIIKTETGWGWTWRGRSLYVKETKN